ncbi:extracellular solute-binding protein [Nonomuraea sp. PA05]|uniref:extracellular solute-binding protein n=1 Tax=Nonomuraea sp. PA05 TaxID=2604466 RepID=UPI0011D5281B|nr:extracellular solute-binding protein [Nonomuraea sp. PA05]TYB71324.1 extracellular solute-binding protein [Nonomuraea sp. PA05]
MRDQARPIRRAAAAAASAALLLAGSAACGGGASDGGGKVVLTLWHGFTEADGKMYEKLIGEFNRENPDVEIRPQANTWDVIANKLLPALSAKLGPDIVAQPTSSAVTYIKKAAFVPLDGYYRRHAADAANYAPAAVQAAEVDGRKYGVPFAFAPDMLYYNKTMFAAAGVTEPPKTWDDWVETARRLTADKNGDGVPEQYGLALTSHGAASQVIWSGMLAQNGGAVVRDGAAVLDSPQNVRTLTYWQRAVREHRISPPGMDDLAATDLFAAKKAAMIVLGPWMAQRSKQAGIDYGIAPIPAGPVSAAVGTHSIGMYATVQAGAAKLAAAERFFAFFNGKRRQIEWSVGSGWPPNRIDVTPGELSANADVAAISTSSEDAVVDFSGVVDFTGVGTDFDTATQKSISGEPVPRTLADSQRKIQAKLNEE